MTESPERSLPRVTVRAKGQITLPPAVRAALYVNEGDQLEFAVDENGEVTVRGMRLIPADQAWYWTPEWQAKEREADADIAAGGGTVYHSETEFLESLRERTPDPALPKHQ